MLDQIFGEYAIKYAHYFAEAGQTLLMCLTGLKKGTFIFSLRLLRGRPLLVRFAAWQPLSLGLPGEAIKKALFPLKQNALASANPARDTGNKC